MIVALRQASLLYQAVFLLILLGYMMMIVLGLSTYLDAYSTNTILGTLAIVCTWNGSAQGKTRIGYLFVLTATIIIYCWVPSKFILYFTIGLALLSTVETLAGRAGKLAIICLLLMSPLAEYFSNVFGFPIRLQLTALAGQILHSIDTKYRTQGNMLVNGNSEFAVDAACMGLHMLISSLLAGLILVGIHQRKANKRLGIPYLLIIGVSIICLNLFANLIRIITLVQFHISPENNLHAAVGLACFILYTLIPSVFMVKYAVKRFPKLPFGPKTIPNLNKKTLIMEVSLLLILSLIICFGKNRSMNSWLVSGAVSCPQYHVENLADGIVKLSTDKTLVYLKPILGFYSSDHQPTMCWKGSGYEFRKLELVNLDGQMIYTSTLEKGSEKLFTAWWYDNGVSATISQLAWRWDAFKNTRSWALVNVTAASERELLEQIQEVKKINPCAMLLRR